VLGFSLKNTSTNIFVEPAIRQAIACAIDQKKLIAEALKGLAKPANQLVPFQAFGFDFSLPPLHPDLEQARRLLIPYRDRLKASQKLYFGGNGAEIAAYIQKTLAPLGIQMEPERVERTKFDDLLFHQDASAYILQFSFPSMDASDILYDSFHTMTADRNYGSMNFSGYSNPRLDSILEESSTELNPGKRYELLRRGMQLALESHAMLPLCVRSNLFVAAKNLRWAGNGNARIILQEIKAE
jgi:peptide/nickel transport system substrate-binding protein